MPHRTTNPVQKKSRLNVPMVLANLAMMVIFAAVIFTPLYFWLFA